MIRIPCPHFSIKISTRSKSPPTTAQAAYQSGERLYDERTHRTKNYTEKRGIVYTEILLPENAPRAYVDRNTLWNAVEKAETNRNAQMARRLEIALPVELPMENNIHMIRNYCQTAFVAKGMIADIAVHDPDPPGHNPHAHVMLTMRAMDEHGNWLPKCRREYEYDADGNRIRDADGNYIFTKVFTTDWDDRGNAERWRQAWEETQNRYLEAAGCPERISMKSYERQGVDQIPTVHMGPAVTAMERAGIETEIGNLNQEIRKTNCLIAAMKKAIAGLVAWIAALSEEIRQAEIDPQEIPLADLLMQRFDERQQERTDWSARAKQKAGVKDLQRFAEMIAFMETKGIRSVADLDAKIAEADAAMQPTKEQIKAITGRIKLVKKLLDAGQRRAQTAPIREQYQKIFWKKSKEKFALEHKQELDAWNKADRFLRKYLHDQPFNAKTLQKELSFLNAELQKLNVELEPHRDETQLLDDIRYYVRDLIPELMPTAEEPTEPKQKKSMKDRLERAKREAEAYNAERQTERNRVVETSSPQKPEESL